MRHFSSQKKIHKFCGEKTKPQILLKHHRTKILIIHDKIKLIIIKIYQTFYNGVVKSSGNAILYCILFILHIFDIFIHSP